MFGIRLKCLSRRYKNLLIHTTGGAMRSSDLIRDLKEIGCTLHRQGKGSHQIWYSPVTGQKFPVPHPKQHLPVGTVRSIKKSAGLL
ncbi:type II toxin-antitoxin system HicA family toxin [Photobacterium obscurum]|uniref:type II toxin-antitoxin system HicA family toxin n=1 Tax=Photobacterium obscurum TaxID=2829490 RepID=UPI002ADD762C|nr:type II toxin-antitoxin system HicA family toxin [Photobacterium obscurum]